MKELNEKLIISISAILLVIGLGFNFLYPSQKSIEAKAPTTIKEYNSIDIPEALAVNADWPEPQEQAKGEMFDLFTPPEIYINEDGEFVFRPPYAVIPKGPFGIQLVDTDIDLYRFQLEGYVEEDRNDQNKTIILVYSVEDGKSLHLSPDASNTDYKFKILDWRIDRNFGEDQNNEVIAWLKIEDFLTNRIINLRHDKNFYEDRMQIAFKVDDTNEIYLLSAVNTSFFVGDIEFRLDSVDFENETALVTKLIPDAEPITELLSINTNSKGSTDTEIKASANNKSNQPASIEDAFNSFF
jgi:hypothetical protein